MTRKLGQPFNRMLEDRDREFAKLEQRLAEEAMPFEIKSNSDCWTIPNVSYKGRIYALDLSKSLLNNGALQDQEYWLHHKVITPKNNFQAGDMPLHFSLFSAISKAKGRNAGEVKDFLEDQMSSQYLATLTTIIYEPTGKDKIIHNLGTRDKYSNETKFHGLTGALISESNSDNHLPVSYLLGIHKQEIPEINKVFREINNSKVYLWRLHSKAKRTDKRVVAITANPHAVFLHCNISEDQAIMGALGMRIFPQESSQ